MHDRAVLKQHRPRAKEPASVNNGSPAAPVHPYAWPAPATGGLGFDVDPEAAPDPPRPEARKSPAVGLVVMAPIAVGLETRDRDDRELVVIKTEVASRILSIVREHFPNAQRPRRGLPVSHALPGYLAAAGRHPVTLDEMDSAIDANARGATHLLVPIISEWHETPLYDPREAVTPPPDSVRVTLRLMHLQTPRLAGQVMFHNRARLSANRRTIHLLDRRFKQALLQLLAC